jgi:NAD(P)-dependent dehydrogenase (short-subunit alcohol dehydrogenase family)
MITGANTGIGKELARQLGLRDNVTRVVLACRNADKAAAARAELVTATGRDIYDVVLIDTGDLRSSEQAALALTEPVDAVVMNAGGFGGKNPSALNGFGATHMFAINVLGHAVLLNTMITEHKLSKVAILAGSEAARGAGQMRIPRPAFESTSVEELTSVIDGTFFATRKYNDSIGYAYTKYIAALWMSAEARRHPELRLLTVSPGGTAGTDAARDLPAIARFGFDKILMGMIGPALKFAHPLGVGAARHLTALDDPTFRSGVFYGSPAHKLTGPLVDQGEFFPDLTNPTYQDNAYRAVHRFID